MKPSSLLPHHLARRIFLLSLPLWIAISQPASAAFNLLSPQQEAQMGIEAFKEMKSKMPSVRSGSQYNTMMRVASRLRGTVQVPYAQWEFVLFKDDSPNAFALPGGKVGVHTGLFKVTRTEGQLAAVLGHELAHVTARHSGQRVSRSAVGSALGGIAGIILSEKTGMSRRGAQTAAQGAATLGVLRFSRSQELEADRLGAIYMAKAGYNPNDAITLWKNMSAYKAKAGAGAPPVFLSTHPVDSRRIEQLEEVMPQALVFYKGGGTAARTVGSPSSNTSTPRTTSAPVRAIKVEEEPKRRFRLFGRN
ncbi:MAG: M48 family metallopeptidase [Verrucomicrobiota bacterium]